MGTHAPRIGLDIPAQGTSKADLSCCRGTRGSGLPWHPGLPRLPLLRRERESGVLASSESLPGLQPLVGRACSQGFGFRCPRLLFFRVWSNLVRISVPPSSPALTPAPPPWLDQIRDDSKSPARGGAGARE